MNNMPGAGGAGGAGGYGGGGPAGMAPGAGQQQGAGSIDHQQQQHQMMMQRQQQMAYMQQQQQQGMYGMQQQQQQPQQPGCTMDAATMARYQAAANRQQLQQQQKQQHPQTMLEPFRNIPPEKRNQIMQQHLQQAMQQAAAGGRGGPGPGYPGQPGQPGMAGPGPGGPHMNPMAPGHMQQQQQPGSSGMGGAPTGAASGGGGARVMPSHYIKQEPMGGGGPGGPGMGGPGGGPGGMMGGHPGAGGGHMMNNIKQKQGIRRGSNSGAGRNTGFGEGRETRDGGERGRLARGVPASAGTLSTAGLIKFGQGATVSTGNDLVRALDQARITSRILKKEDFKELKNSNGHDPIIALDDGYSKEIDFGYVNAGESKIFVLKGRNLLSFFITCRYSLRGSKNRAPCFSIMDGTEIIVQGGGSLEVKLQFTPPQVANFYDYLSIEVSGGGINKTYNVLLCGIGGRANVVLMPRSGLHPHRSSSEFLLQSSSSQTASIGVENTGQRTAYVRAVVLDGYDRRVEGVIFTPSDSFVLLPNTQQPIKVDLSQSNWNENGRCSSSLGSNGGVRFRRSSPAPTASVNSISSSASSASRIPPAYKIVLYSGEDIQRQRMIGWCVGHGHTSFPPLCSVDEDFSRPFVGEEPNIDKKRPNFYSSDMNLFIASIRKTTINVHLCSNVETVTVTDKNDPHNTAFIEDVDEKNGL